jgi:protein-tyrosine phosphatase
VSDEEHGNPIDPRAVTQLRSAGYTPGSHSAHRVTDAELAEADLVIGLEEHHVRALRRRAPAADVRLLTEFDPDARPGEGVPDPWYGGREGFVRTAQAIEAAVPGVLAHLRHRPGQGVEPEASA